MKDNGLILAMLVELKGGGWTVCGETSRVEGKLLELERLCVINSMQLLFFKRENI